MGAMSQLAAEKDQEINMLHADYLEAYQDYQDYMERHPIAWRNLSQQSETVRLEGICMVARDRYERANERRHQI